MHMPERMAQTWREICTIAGSFTTDGQDYALTDATKQQTAQKKTTSPGKLSLESAAWSRKLRSKVGLG